MDNNNPPNPPVPVPPPPPAGDQGGGQASQTQGQDQSQVQGGQSAGTPVVPVPPAPQQDVTVPPIPTPPVPPAPTVDVPPVPTVPIPETEAPTPTETAPVVPQPPETGIETGAQPTPPATPEMAIPTPAPETGIETVTETGAPEAQAISPEEVSKEALKEEVATQMPPPGETPQGTGNNENLVDRFLPIAVEKEASDLYLVANFYPSMKDSGQIVSVKDGFAILTAEDIDAFIREITTEEQYKEYQEQLELDFAYSHGNGRFRVNIFHQMKYPSVCLRFLRSKIPSLDELGLPPIFKSLAERHDGIILLAGPTGSGKSTTLGAMVDHINSNKVKHIITIEDPVEYLHPLKQSIVEQREVGTDCVSFERAMKSALRQNPNVLVLGEMRDLESVSSAITIAETGHLVFSTIHARSAVQTINKIIDIFPAEQQNQIRQQISETLLAVISQRLIPKKDGSGQTLAMEVMVVNNAIGNMVREQQTHQIESIIQTSKADGMILLEDDLIRLIQEDTVTIDDALRVCNDPHGLNEKLISLGLVD